MSCRIIVQSVSPPVRVINGMRPFQRMNGGKETLPEFVLSLALHTGTERQRINVAVDVTRETPTELVLVLTVLSDQTGDLILFP